MSIDRSGLACRAVSLGLVLASGIACGGTDADTTRVAALSPAAPAPSPAVPSPDVPSPAAPEPAAPAASPEAGELFPTSSVVFGEEGETTYVNVLDTLEGKGPDPRSAVELAGWADLWVHGGKVFVADGEAPVLTRYAVDAGGSLHEEGQLSFQNFGAAVTAFTNQLFVSESKAYWFNNPGREVVTWDPVALATGRVFALPELPDRGGQLLAGPSADRSSVVRGNRAFVPFYWANWDEYALSEDSVILVFDTDSDTVIDVISVPCPEINFASVDDQGTIYFSNWGFSAVPAVLDAKAQACAVRIPAGSDTLDPSWSFKFADVTEGREASALRMLGNGQALLTVFHDERADLGPDVDRFALTDSANWRLWVVDLERRTAAPLETLGWHAPGLYGVQLQGQTFLFVPSSDYASTTTYRFSLDGAAAPLWQSTGWQTRLFDLKQ